MLCIISATMEGLTMVQVLAIYRKIPIISSGLIFVQKAFLQGLFSGELILKGLSLEGILHFKMSWA